MADGKQFNMRNPAVKRILQEVKEMQKEGCKDYMSMPLEEDIFEWQFAIHGPKDSEFEGGIYHGRITLPAEYPFKPPSFMLLTPSGRFEVQTKICLSISNHHPEHWQPSWSVRTALVALIAFMPTKPDGALGSLDYPKDERRQLAIKSRLAPPKFGSPGRQQVIDQIHAAMVETAPPIPTSLPPGSSPAPKTPDTPQDPPATAALPPAAVPVTAASDSAPSPSSSTEPATDQADASLQPPQPAAGQVAPPSSTSPASIDASPSTLAASGASCSSAAPEPGQGASAAVAGEGLAADAAALREALPAVSAGGAAAAAAGGAKASAGSSASRSAGDADGHGLTEPLLPPPAQSMADSRQLPAAAAAAVAAAAAAGAGAPSGVEGRGAGGSLTGQAQAQVQAARRGGGGAAEDRVLNTLAAAIVVAIVALLLRKFLRVYSPLEEAASGW